MVVKFKKYTTYYKIRTIISLCLFWQIDSEPIANNTVISRAKKRNRDASKSFGSTSAK